MLYFGCSVNLRFVRENNMICFYAVFLRDKLEIPEGFFNDGKELVFFYGSVKVFIRGNGKRNCKRGGFFENFTDKPVLNGNKTGKTVKYNIAAIKIIFFGDQ